MFIHFTIFCMVLVLAVLGTHTGVIHTRAAPALGTLAGGALGLAYGGALISGAVTGLLAAAVCAGIYRK